jgi:outer membrane protein assembly factor BamB
MKRTAAPLLDCRRWGWSRILCLTLCAFLLVIGPGAEASTDGPRVWVSRYNGPGNGPDQAYSVATSPDGTKVFVTGWSLGITSGFDYATVAYDAATGAQLWESRYDGPANGEDKGQAVKVSPDGTKVFVTGWSLGITSSFDYATVAYDAATGAQLWESRYNGPGNGEDSAYSVAASPDGTKVFVTGRSWGIACGFSAFDYATVAYDAATGAQLWESRYNAADRQDDGHSVKVSPDGTKVFVTGLSVGTSGYNDYATVAYDAATGAQLWERRYTGLGIGADARAMDASPDGTEVFVTGTFTVVPKLWESSSCHVTSGNYDWATVAYDAATGTQLWVMLYDGPAKGDDEPHAIAVGPDGTEVFVTGRTATTMCWNYVTIAYDAATGALLWRRFYNGPPKADDAAYSVAVSPDGTKVFVTGGSIGTRPLNDYATVAYDAATGAQLWVTRYDGPAHGEDTAASVAVSPDATRVFVTGWSMGTSDLDYATVAFAA